MKTKVITQTKIVHEESAKAFEARMNEVLMTVGEPTIKYLDSVPFCAYITFQTEADVAETAEDEYVKEVGERACCGDCPYLEMNKDKRVKHHTCKYSEFARKVTTPACELYYQRLLNGTFMKEGA